MEVTQDQKILAEALALNRIVRLTSSNLDFQEMMASICRELAQALNVPLASMALLDSTSGELRLVARYCQPGREKATGELLSITSSPAARQVLASGAPAVIADVSVDPLFASAQDLTRRRGIVSIMILPLLIQKRVVGTLGLDSLEPHPFSGDDLAFAQEVAAAASRSLEMAQLYERLKREQNQREQLARRLKAAEEEVVGKEAELEEAREQSTQSSRMVNEFLAFMSHEIRTPITSIIGMTELLFSTRLDHEQRDYAGVVRDSASVLLSLINDILDFSKMQAGRLTLETTRFDPLTIVESASEMFAAEAREKNLSLMVYVSPEIPSFLMGDPFRLRQVLLNLIGNAIKFTSTGEVNVRAVLAGKDEESAILRFEVQDTGIGISPQAHKNLFQPFFQAEENTARRFGGTGLGLAISRQLVEIMGGEIGLDSAEGKGSTFWFTVPFKLYISADGKTTTPLRVSLQGMHVLVVDDNPDHRKILHAYMDSWGMRCSEASGIADSFHLLEQGLRDNDPYVVMVVDLHLQDGSGLSLAGMVEKREELASTHLILMTAFDQYGLGDEALAQGFSAYLTKPVRQSLLYDAVAGAVLSQPFSYGEGTALPEAQPPIFNSVEQFSEEHSPSGEEKKLVLLVEDNSANQRLGMIQLQKLGYRVDTAVTGRQAVDAAHRSPGRYALILMDCQMPDMDGMAATRAIREGERPLGIHVPIVAMTANALPGDREACLSAGMDDYISKPVPIEALRQLAEKWAGHRAAGKGAYQTGSLAAARHTALDPQMLKDIRELQPPGEPDFLTDLIDMFLADSQVFINLIQQNLETGDLVAIRRPIHSLKGTSANLGAAILPSLCAEMESLVVKGDLKAAQAFLTVVANEYERVRAALIRERVDV